MAPVPRGGDGCPKSRSGSGVREQWEQCGGGGGPGVKRNVTSDGQLCTAAGKSPVAGQPTWLGPPKNIHSAKILAVFRMVFDTSLIMFFDLKVILLFILK